MTLADRLRALVPRLVSIAPAGTPVETIIENVIHVIQHDSDLAACTVGSIIDAVTEALSLGLDPSGLSGDGRIIPRKSTKTGVIRAVFIPDYRALLRLMAQSDRVLMIETRVVKDEDTLVLRFGDGPPTERIVDHQPDVNGIGKPIGAYAIAWLRDCPRPLVEWMPKAEIDANAERGGAGLDDGAWATDWPEMARKTVIKRLAKHLLPQLYPRAVASLGDDGEADAAPERPASDLFAQYRESIETAAPDGIDHVIRAIREDDRLDHVEKTELYNLACRRKREIKNRPARRPDDGKTDSKPEAR